MPTSAELLKTLKGILEWTDAQDGSQDACEKALNEIAEMSLRELNAAGVCVCGEQDPEYSPLCTVHAAEVDKR